MNHFITWDSTAQPQRITLQQILYQCRRADGDNALLLDAVCMADILEGADEILVFDALVSTYAGLERKMLALQNVMTRAGDTVKPMALQISEPFKQQGVAQVAAIFELSDGQTVSIFFHNPDVTPQKMAPGDSLVSWKWLLNKRDVTILVAPERGKDLNVREVATRIMKLAAKNSAAFQRANAKRAENLQAIESLKTEIAALEQELADAQHELEVAKQAYEDRSLNPHPQEQDAYHARLDAAQQRFIAVKQALAAMMNWSQGADGVSMVNLRTGHAVVYQPTAANALREAVWTLYQLAGKGDWKPIKPFIDKSSEQGYAETPEAFANGINAAANAEPEPKVAKREAEARPASAPETPVTDPVDEQMNQRYQAVKAELQKLGWQISPDGVSLQSPDIGWALVPRKTSLSSRWRIYRLMAKGTWKFVKELADKTDKKGYVQTPAQFAKALHHAALDAAVSAEQKAKSPARSRFAAELDALKAETDIVEFDRKLDEIVLRIELAGLMDELDAELNAAADQLTALLAKAEKRVK
ncbi:hypothetical protein [Candidatus Methylomicrobium oryzae]|uniref:defense against restriction DarA-related protein n=1 Tax=Candidatus Methylomicrobium oryzae TaxID=2802053 RepID=UPI001920CCE2|nr:hypothetical protein [Methylomicrobium sp. RS1]MBL1266103.1 hypothetical protein [Methylomicrobium sp. RS1]